MARSRAGDVETFAFEQAVFSGGVDVIADPRLLGEGFYARSVNAYPTRSGRVRVRSGYTAVAETVGSEYGITTPRAARWLVSERGVTFLIVFYDDIVSAIDPVTGNEAILLTGLDTAGAIATESWQGRVYFSDGVNGLYYVTIPDEDSRAYASITSGAYPNTASITFRAVATGEAGNDIIITLEDGVTSSTSAAYDLGSNTVTISLGTSATQRQISRVVEAVNRDVPTIIEASGTSTNALSPTSVTTAYGMNADTVYVQLATDAYSFSYLKARAASERLFGIDAADRTNLRWSQPFAADQWNSGDVYSPGGEFTAIADYGDTLLPMSRDIVYRIDGTDPATWQARKVPSDKLGCIAPLSVEVLDGIPVWLSARGLVLFDGSKVKQLSQRAWDGTRLDDSIIVADDGAFSVQTDALYVLYQTRMVAGEYGDEPQYEAVVYDYQRNAFGGPYIFGFHPVAAACDLASDIASVPWVFTSTGIVAKEAGATDLGAPVTATIRGRTIDGARPLLDKVFNDVRLGYFCDAAAAVTLRLVCEDEGVARTVIGAQGTVAATAGDELFRKRVQNARARLAYIEVEVTPTGVFEAYALGTDLFFCRPR